MSSPGFSYSPLSFLSDFTDESAKEECAYVGSEQNSSSNGSFENRQPFHQQQPDVRNDDLIIDIATVLAKMYRTSNQPVPSSLPTPSNSQQSSPVENARTPYESQQTYGSYYGYAPSSYQQQQPYYPQASHYGPSWMDGRYQTYSSLQSTTQTQMYTPSSAYSTPSSSYSTSSSSYSTPSSAYSTPSSSYRSSYDASPPTVSTMLNPRNDHYTSLPPKVTPFTSQFRPPMDLGNEFMSGMDELREWKCEETPEKKPMLPRDDAPITTWDHDADTSVNLRPDNQTNPMPESLQALLATVTKLSRQPSSSLPKPSSRGQKRKAPDVINDLVIDIPEETPTYECEVCHRVFSSRKYLKNHSRSHNKELKRFECEVCKNTFGAKSTLKIHMRIHTGEMPYNCNVCKKPFRDFSTFIKHKRIHTGERPYECHICGLAFTQGGNLKRHGLAKHPEFDF